MGVFYLLFLLSIFTTTAAGAEPAPLQRNVADILETLTRLGAPPPKLAELQELLKAPPDDTAATEKVQALLDPLCLVTVSINPESRVKAARGAAAAELRQGERSILLIKVINEAGVTSALEVSGEHLRERGKPITAEAWLDARVMMPQSRSAQLTGQPLQYVMLVLGTTEAGKREARLAFDVGQGTQDLGFRAEVPILFTIRAMQ
jgi:hypothetical protein